MKKRCFAAMVLVLAAFLALCTCAFAEGPVYARSLKMTRKKASITMKYGAPNTVQLHAVTVPAEELLTEKIEWVSASPRVATVDENGIVTAVAPGKSRVYARVKGPTKTLSVMCVVTVKAVRVTEVVLSQANTVVLDPTDAAERSAVLTATVKPANASFQDVAWESSDTSVATVDNGTIKAVGTGNCTVTASCGSKSTSIKVTCRDKSKMIPITLSAGGDIVLGGDKPLKTYQRFERFIDQNGYGYVLKNLKKVFEKDDFTILNLECPLEGRENPRKAGRQYAFSGKPEYVNILTEGSVEVVNIMNNHMDDFGTRTQTRNHLKNAGIKISEGEIRSEYNYITINRGGESIRVGFLGILTPKMAASVKSLVNRVKLGERGRDNGIGPGCDILIVSFHFGDVPEHKYPVRPSQVAQARAAVQGGANLVLGHHTHVPSGIEVYRDAYIYYGLGAVESSGPNFKYNNFITQQTLLYDPDTGYTECQKPTIYPINPSSAAPDDYNNCQPMLLSPGDSRYDEVFRIIDTYSVKAKKTALTTAPYIKGVP